VFLDLVFHSSELPYVSPMVSLWWEADVIDLLNALPQDLWPCDSSPEKWFVDLLAGLMALPVVGRNQLEVRNVPVPTEWFAAGGREWYDRLMSEFDAFDAPPALVSVTPPYVASRARVQLCRWEPTGSGWHRAAPGTSSADD